MAITEEFMNAVEADEEYQLRNPRDGEPIGPLKAREVFDKIVKNAWLNGDPGIVFIDRINDDNPTPHVGEIESTNPCGEQPLLPYESCNLGSINLSRMLKTTGDNGSTRHEVDWDKLADTTHGAVHFLDNVIDMNRYPIEEIAELTRSNRKIGLGVMGFADMLLMLGISYNSDDAIDIGKKVMSFIREEGRNASKDLAKIRGTFPNFVGSIYDDQNLELRNATITTIAPTGTISIMGSCSSGIEPLFALAFTRNVMDGTELLEVNPLFEEAATMGGFDDPEIMKQVAEQGSLHDIEGLPEGIKDLFVTAHDINPEWHTKMQAAFQESTDNAVSKTVNFPSEATEEDVAEAYLLSHRLGCKGVTVYRDGSRDGQVLTTGSDKNAAAPTELEDTTHEISPRPKERGEVAFGITKKMKTGCGNLYVVINEDEEGQPFEIFTQIGKAGGCVASQCEAMGRMTSLALRSGIEPGEIVSQMRGISCHLPVGYGTEKVMSCADAMAQALAWYLKLKHSTAKASGGERSLIGNAVVAGTASALDPNFGHEKLEFTLADNNIFQRGACPDCGGTVEHSDGCVVCRGCGYTECG